MEISSAAWDAIVILLAEYLQEGGHIRGLSTDAVEEAYLAVTQGRIIETKGA